MDLTRRSFLAVTGASPLAMVAAQLLRTRRVCRGERRSRMSRGIGTGVCPLLRAILPCRSSGPFTIRLSTPERRR